MPNQPPISPFPQNQAGAPFSIPAVPFPELSKPLGNPPMVVTPSIQPSPGHFTSTQKDSVGETTSPTGRNKPGQPKIPDDPRWAAAVKEYENKSKQYQETIDHLLAKHGQSWESLCKDPRDRLACDEIMRRWRGDESKLQTLYNQLLNPVTPDPSENYLKSKRHMELNVDDIDH
jgi:hypothetical protein